MTASKEERLRKVAQLAEPDAWNDRLWLASFAQVQFAAKKRALSKAEAIDLLYAEEIGRLRGALERSAEGWANAVELKIIAPQHVLAATILGDEARSALSQGLGDGGDGASNATRARRGPVAPPETDAEPSGAREP